MTRAEQSRLPIQGEIENCWCKLEPALAIMTKQAHYEIPHNQNNIQDSGNNRVGYLGENLLMIIRPVIAAQGYHYPAKNYVQKA